MVSYEHIRRDGCKRPQDYSSAKPDVFTKVRQRMNDVDEATASIDDFRVDL